MIEAQKDTLTVGSLVLTKEGSSYKYEEGQLKLLVYLGWKDNMAVVTTQYLSGCSSVQSAGELPLVIESTLGSIRQNLEQEVRRATKRLAAFNTQFTEVIGKAHAQVNSTQPEAS